MPVTLTGAEYKRFYSDPAIWDVDGHQTYLDEDSVTVNGSDVDGTVFDPEALRDADIVVVRAGYLVDAPAGTPEDYVAAIRKWLRKRATQTLVVEFPADKRDEIVAAIRGAGGKVID